MSFLRQLNIQTRIWIQLAVVVFGFALVIFEGVRQLDMALIEQKVKNTRFQVDLAHSTLAYYYNLQQSGALSEGEAQKQAIEAIANLRYDGENYFWLQDASPRMIMHPFKPALNGTSIRDNKDPNGKHLFVEMSKIATTEGEGEVDYQWPLPGETKPVNKISYVKMFKPWGWIVGSGVYIQDIEAAYREASFTPIVFGIGMVLCVAILSLVVGRSITKPLQQTSAALNNIAQGDGDLTLRLEETPHYKDELSTMSRDFNAFVSKIEAAIQQVHNATQYLTNTSNQQRQTLQNANDSISRQQQESQAIASAIMEMSSTVNHIASNAESAACSAQEGREQANSGRNTVQQTIAAVNALASDVNKASSVITTLNQNSQSISTVLEVIRSIAEQTNLLALNAAIEAARAGEQGRGFAVVADEVRTLAARTQSATEEIRQMIQSLQDDSGEAVNAMEKGEKATQHTTEQAGEAGKALASIVESINAITDLNMQIASAAEEQSSAVQEINRGIESMVDLGNQTSQEMQNSSKTSAELQELSNSLQGLVSGFKVSAG